MKNLKSIIVMIAMSLFVLVQSGKSQCTWETVVTDGFEYQTIIPNLIPGATIHNTPQSFAVHSGAWSAYLNFTNCVGGTGTCAGAKVYERGFAVCRNQPLQFSTWLTTSFGGTQCNVRIEITDGAGNVLNNQANIPAPYAPAWFQYQSGNVVPLTDSVIFTMYTNVGGGGGNDLSMDDFMLQKCSGATTSTTAGGVCDNVPSANLYSMIPGISDTTGIWSGPSSLSGGYQGTFATGTSLPGSYIYTYTPYGTNPGCPLGFDTVVVSLTAAPVVNLGNDTTLCTNQSMLLNAGSAPGNTYLWNNGVTGPNVLAFTSGSTNVTNTYSVLVTNTTTGCANGDTIVISFEVCSGLNELGKNEVNLYPNPANVELYVNNASSNAEELTYSIYNTNGSLDLQGVLGFGNNTIQTTSLNEGMYLIQFTNSNGASTTKKFMIRK